MVPNIRLSILPLERKKKKSLLRSDCFRKRCYPCNVVLYWSSTLTQSSVRFTIHTVYCILYILMYINFFLHKCQSTANCFILCLLGGRVTSFGLCQGYLQASFVQKHERGKAFSLQYVTNIYRFVYVLQNKRQNTHM
jgi:hypothetical protein